MPDQKEVSILGLTVPVSQPYAEGHTITAAEAKALNQTRAENIGNLVRKAFETARGEDKTYSDEARAKLLALVAEKDASYVFNLASAGGGRKPTDPIEKEAISIAKAQISMAIKDKGKTLKEVIEKNGKEWLDAKIAEIADKPEIRKIAAKRVKERESGAEALDLGI